MYNLTYIVKPEISTVFIQDNDGVICAGTIDEKGNYPIYSDDMNNEFQEITGYEIGDLNYSRLLNAFDAIKSLDY